MASSSPSSLWPRWSENPFFTVLFAVLLAYGIVYLGAVIRKTLMETAYIGVAERQPAKIMVNGVGSSDVVPDIAVFDFSLGAVAADGATAQANASANAEKVIAALRALGIADQDIRTTNVSVYEQYNDAMPPVVVGYRGDYSLSVKVRDQSKVQAAVDAALQNGATNMYGPRFELEDPMAGSTEARKEAVANAQKQALEIARAMGARLGGVVSYSEYTGGYLPYGKGGMISAAMPMMAEDAAVAEIMPGSSEVTINVTVEYAIY